MQINYKNFLRKYYPIPDADFELLFTGIKTVSYKKGELITAAGQVQRDILFVFKGVQMAYYEHGEKEHVMLFTYPHSLSGIGDSFLLQKPSEYNLRALTDSEFGAISHKELNDLFDKNREIERLFRKMIEQQFCGLLLRHKEFHAYTIEERFRAFAKRSAHLFQLVPHKYIANYLKIDPTNFSKLYNSVII